MVSYRQRNKIEKNKFENFQQLMSFINKLSASSTVKVHNIVDIDCQELTVQLKKHSKLKQKL